jgi:hypothetical protein
MVEVDEIKQIDYFSVFSEKPLEELSKITEISRNTQCFSWENAAETALIL